MYTNSLLVLLLYISCPFQSHSNVGQGCSARRFKYLIVILLIFLLVGCFISLDWKPMEAQSEHDVRVPFEMHAYDAIFTTVKVLQSQQFDRIHRVAVELLAYTKKGSLLPLELQERIRELKNVTAKMSGKLESYRRVLNELIENDQDMALMNLTMLRDNPTLYR